MWKGANGIKSDAVCHFIMYCASDITTAVGHNRIEATMLKDLNDDITTEYEIINKLMYCNPHWDFEQSKINDKVHTSGVYDMNWSQVNKFVQLLHDGPLRIEFNEIYNIDR